MTWTLANAAAAAVVVGVRVAVQSKPMVRGYGAAARERVRANNGAGGRVHNVGFQRVDQQLRLRHRNRDDLQLGMAPESFDCAGDEPGDNLAAVVVGRDGGHTELATWVTLAGVTA